MSKDLQHITQKDLICIGAFAGAHGVRGCVRVKSFTQDPASFFNFETVYTQDASSSYHFLNATPKGSGIYISKVEEITSREEAESLKSTKLYALREDFPDLDEGEFYVRDLVGLQVQLNDSTILGQVKSVQNFGAGDVLEITLKDSSEVVMLPFSNEAVPAVSISEGYIVANRSVVDGYMKDKEGSNE